MATEPKQSKQTLSKQHEQQLIRDAQAGIQASARALIDAHKQRLLAFVWRIVPNNDDAEDVCQDAFLRAFSSIQSFDFNYRFSTWLFTIAYRLCLNLKRRRTTAGCDYPWQTEEGNLPGPGSIAQSREAESLMSDIWDAVSRLSEPQQATIMLFYRENMPCHEIAKVMGAPVATVKSHLHRARARLRTMLEPAWVERCEEFGHLGERIA